MGNEFSSRMELKIGRDKKRFFFGYQCWYVFAIYPLRTLCSRKKSVISVLWENVEINFENLSAIFFLFGCFSVFSMCNLLWKRSFVLYSCFFIPSFDNNKSVSRHPLHFVLWWKWKSMMDFAQKAQKYFIRVPVI